MSDERYSDPALVIREKHFHLNDLLDDIGLIGMMAEKIQTELPQSIAKDTLHDLDVILSRQKHLMQLVEHLVKTGQLKEEA